MQERETRDAWERNERPSEAPTLLRLLLLLLGRRSTVLLLLLLILLLLAVGWRRAVPRVVAALLRRRWACSRVVRRLLVLLRSSTARIETRVWRLARLRPVRVARGRLRSPSLLGWTKGGPVLGVLLLLILLLGWSASSSSRVRPRDGSWITKLLRGASDGS